MYPCNYSTYQFYISQMKKPCIVARPTLQPNKKQHDQPCSSARLACSVMRPRCSRMFGFIAKKDRDQPSVSHVRLAARWSGLAVENIKKSWAIFATSRVRVAALPLQRICSMTTLQKQKERKKKTAVLGVLRIWFAAPSAGLQHYCYKALERNNYVGAKKNTTATSPCIVARPGCNVACSSRPACNMVIL